MHHHHHSFYWGTQCHTYQSDNKFVSFVVIMYLNIRTTRSSGLSRSELVEKLSTGARGLGRRRFSAAWQQRRRIGAAAATIFPAAATSGQANSFTRWKGVDEREDVVEVDDLVEGGSMSRWSKSNTCLCVISPASVLLCVSIYYERMGDISMCLQKGIPAATLLPQTRFLLLPFYDIRWLIR